MPLLVIFYKIHINHLREFGNIELINKKNWATYCCPILY